MTIDNGRSPPSEGQATHEPSPPVSALRVSVLNALAGRCEQASGADRALDHMIASNTMPNDMIGAPLFLAMSYDDWVAHLGLNQSSWVPQFTASLDAAMTLLTGCATLTYLSEIGAEGLAMAAVGRPDLESAPVFRGIAAGVNRDTPLLVQLALAVTAAALRAQATQAHEGE